METSLLLPFLVGCSVCFVGTLPFGPVNLTVVKKTVDRNHLRGLEVAVVASVVEILHALIAILFGMVISDFLANSHFFRLLIALAFLLVGIVIWRKKPQEQMGENRSTGGSEIKTGLLVSLLNPQAIPFWIFALATINAYTGFSYDGVFLGVFLAGVFVGKLSALTGFVILSHYLKTHLKQSAQLVNHVLAAVLFFIGITQLIRFAFAQFQ